jgi:hypothetical protein
LPVVFRRLIGMSVVVARATGGYHDGKQTANKNQ